MARGGLADGRGFFPVWRRFVGSDEWNELSDAQCRVLLVIWSEVYATGEERGTWRTTRKELGELARKTDRQVSDALRALDDAHLIKFEARRGAGVFIRIPCSSFDRWRRLRAEEARQAVENRAPSVGNPEENLLVLESNKGLSGLKLRPERPYISSAIRNRKREKIPPTPQSEIEGAALRACAAFSLQLGHPVNPADHADLVGRALAAGHTEAELKAAVYEAAHWSPEMQPRSPRSLWRLQAPRSGRGRALAQLAAAGLERWQSAHPSQPPPWDVPGDESSGPLAPVSDRTPALGLGERKGPLRAARGVAYICDRLSQLAMAGDESGAWSALVAVSKRASGGELRAARDVFARAFPHAADDADRLVRHQESKRQQGAVAWR